MAFFREQLRYEQYEEIYVSPHMDDAAYSCGGRILQSRPRGARVLVLTVFGSGRAAAEQEPQTQFTDYAARSAEELSVMQRLDADFIWLNYPELLFRKHSLWDVLRFFIPTLRLSGPAHDALFEATLQVLAQRLAPGGVAYFPLSVGFHPDHRLLFDVGRALQALGRFRIVFYEDVPYSLAPPLTALRLKLLGVATPLGLGAAASELTHFWLRQYGKLGSYLWLPLLLYLRCLVWLYALGRALAGARREAAPRPTRCDIAAVIEQKADILRLYPSQTLFFLTLDASLADRIKPDGQAREQAWLFSEADGPVRRLSAAQRAIARRVLGEAAPEPPR
jgi:LmbE family N-acetylglucosaminyl deacetylase